MNIATHARWFAVGAHCGQNYGTKPYRVHTDQVGLILKRYGFGEEVIAAGYLHDTIEDCHGRVDYDQLAELFGEQVATIVEAVTDEPGKNRQIRKAKTYPKTRRVPEAVAVKLADRIANLQASLKQSRKGYAFMYRKEHAVFREALYRAGEYEDMWAELEELCEAGKVSAEERVM